MKPLLSLSALAFTLITASTVVERANSQQRVQHHAQEPVHTQSGDAGMPMTGSMDPAMMQQMMKDMMPSPSDAASTKAFKEVQLAMMRNMRVGFTGDADVDFRTHMIPHHQAAIDMAKAALTHAKNKETKTLARAIIEAQEKEIADMRKWLKNHGK
jgi:uncharacterized protein (DUF305 family)